MKHEIEAMWMGRRRFNALLNGHTVVMDAPERAGGEDQGSIPKPFILSALAGCSGMDVVALLEKAACPVDSFDIKVSGELSKGQPMRYIAVHAVYAFRGASACEEQAISAVAKSHRELCGVSAMLQKIMPVTWDVVYNDRTVFSNHTDSTVATV